MGLDEELEDVINRTHSQVFQHELHKHPFKGGDWRSWREGHKRVLLRRLRKGIVRRGYPKTETIKSMELALQRLRSKLGRLK